MSSLQEFIADYNVLIIDDERVSYYQIVHSGTDEVWRTFPCPTDAEKIQAAITDMCGDLATGSHTVRIQAISISKQILGQIGQSISGKSQAAKQSANDHIIHAKATSMNIETADRQLMAMSARLEEAQKRAQEAEERAGSMIGEVYKMGDIMNKFIVEKESEVLDREARESRNQAMIIIATALAPVLSNALQQGAEFFEIWIKNKKEEARAKHEAKTTSTRNNVVNN